MPAKRVDEDAVEAGLALIRDEGHSPEDAADELKRRFGLECSASTLRRRLKRREEAKAAASKPAKVFDVDNLPDGAELASGHELIMEIQTRFLCALATGEEEMPDGADEPEDDMLEWAARRVPRGAHQALLMLMFGLAGDRLDIIKVDGERLELVNGRVPDP